MLVNNAMRDRNQTYHTNDQTFTEIAEFIFVSCRIMFPEPFLEVLHIEEAGDLT